MKLRLKKVFAIALVSLLVLSGCSTGGGDGGDSGEKYKIYLVTMDQMDQHWVTVSEGAKKAAEELGNVEFTWVAPDVKDDAKQIEALNNAISGGADAILLAANGPDAVTAALREAEAEGIKIIYVDSPANYPAEQTLATDNEAAGFTAGERLIEEFAKKNVSSGDIGVISTNSATASTQARQAGFRRAFEGTDFKVLETQYGDGDVSKSKDIATNFLTAGAVGIFGANEGSTVGAGNAIVEAGGDALAIGFDGSDTIMKLIKDGSLVATMAQNPDVMGYEGVKSAVKVLKGEKLETDSVDTGVTVIDITNVK